MNSMQRLVLSYFSTGLETDVKPFLPNNDAFPKIENALIWRKRLIKKPGSKKLNILMRSLTTASAGTITLTNPSPNIFNLITALGFNVSQPSASITPGNLSNISITIGSQTLTNTTGSTTLSISGTGNITSATINYGTGDLTLTFSAAAGPLSVSFTGSYYPHLPVMGIEPYDVDAQDNVPIDFPNNIYFDTIYAYTYNFGSHIFQDSSFYRTSGAPIIWSGHDYQQFYSSNYFEAMFVTNNNPGLQQIGISAITAANPAVITTSANHDLVNGDLVFLNETTGTAAANLNMKTFVVSVTGATTFTVPANTTAGIGNVGVVQYLTRRSPTSTGDGIRWYSQLGNTTGFSNFAPPLDNLSNSSTNYLVGARIVLPFGNRLLAIGTYETTSALPSSPTYYGNRIRYCQLLPGSPFYANSPTGLGADPLAWVSNIQGFGGFFDLDTTDRIISANITQDSLILGLESDQRKLVTTGIETDPFVVQVINPDFGNVGTYATIALDKGILSVGEYGFLLTTSFNSQRFDERIIDQIWEVSSRDHGFDRISAARDFPNEVIYFSYTNDEAENVFPNRTLVYNYREPSFAVWNESYTTYGIFKNQNITPWEQLTNFTWENWNEPWESGILGQTYPYVAGGNQQGYVMLKWENDSENDASLFISAISGNVITSQNHNLESGQYIGLQALGGPIPTIIGQVSLVSNTNNFTIQTQDSLAPVIPGLWEIVILDNFIIQTKQFPSFWPNAQKIRIGTQRYFLDTTTEGEFTVQLLGSQSPVPINTPPLGVPLTKYPQIISNSIVRTRPDNSLGLNDSQSQQAQIWHRLPTSVLGDTVQIQMTLSDDQMSNLDIATAPWVLHVIVIDLYPSRILA